MRKRLFLFIVLACFNPGKELVANTQKVYAIKTRHTAFSLQDDGSLTVSEKTAAIDAMIGGLVSEKLKNAGIKTVSRTESGLGLINRVLEESKDEDYMDGNSVQARQSGATNILLIESVAFERAQKTDWYLFLQDCDIRTGIIYVEGGLLNQDGSLKAKESEMVKTAERYVDEFLFRYVYGKLVTTSFDKKNMTMYPDAGLGDLGKRSLSLFYEKEKGYESLGMVPGHQIKKEGFKYLVPCEKEWSSLGEKILGTFSARGIKPTITISCSVKASNPTLKKWMHMIVKQVVSEQGSLCLRADDDPLFSGEYELQKSETFMDGTVVTKELVDSPFALVISGVIQRKNQISCKVQLTEDGLEKTSVTITNDITSLQKDINSLIISELR